MYDKTYVLLICLLNFIHQTEHFISLLQTKFEYNCTEIRPGTFEIYSTLWFLGNLVHSNDSHLTAAAIDDSSRSDVLFIPRQNLVPGNYYTFYYYANRIIKSGSQFKFSFTLLSKIITRTRVHQNQHKNFRNIYVYIT
jgi:hypothetical protein